MMRLLVKLHGFLIFMLFLQVGLICIADIKVPLSQNASSHQASFSPPPVSSPSPASSSLPDTSVATPADSLPKLPKQTDAIDNRQDQFEQWFQQELVSAGQYMNEDSARLNQYLQQKASNMGQVYVDNLIKNKAEGLLQQMGQVRLNFTLDETLQFSDYEFDYLLPVFESWHSQVFTQLGARTWQGREMASIGLGYRFFERSFMFGANIFYDKDLTLDHERASLGVEFTNMDWRLSANYYVPVSSWLDQDIKISTSNRIQARAAEGFDISLTGHLPFYRAISGSVEYFKWYGDGVDFGGEFNKSRSMSDLNQLTDSPEGVSASLNWSPVPLLSAGLTYTATLSGERDLSADIELTWNLSESLVAQITPQNTSSQRMLSGMKDAFVKRQSNIVLAYQSVGVKRSVVLPEEIYLVENEKATLYPEVQTANRASVFQWHGSLAVFLDDPTLQNPVLTAPSWQGRSSHFYTLYLVVTDVNGGVFKSNKMQLQLSENANKRPVMQWFYDVYQLKPVTDFKFYSGNYGNKIYWKLLSNRTGQVMDLKKYQWENTDFFIDNLEKYPEINSNVTPGQYEAVLNVDSYNEGNYQIRVPVTLLKAVARQLVWDDSDAVAGKVIKTFDFSKNSGRYFKIAAKRQDGTDVAKLLRYSIASGESNDVAKVNQTTGEVLLLSPGTTRVVAQQDGDNQYADTTISYQLIVNLANSDFYWHADDSMQSNTINKTYRAGLSVQASAVSADGSAITYSVLKQQPAGVASIANADNSTVTVNKAGEATIAATRASDSERISYRLVVAKADPKLSWQQPELNDTGRLIVDFIKPQQAVKQTATALSSAAVQYRIPGRDQQVGELDPSDPDTVKLKKAGSLNVYAYLNEDTQFKFSEIGYTLIASDGKNSGLAWSGNLLKNGVLHETYDLNKRYILQAISDPRAGPIYYQIAPAPDQSIAKIVDNRSGAVDILKPGNTQIVATQKSAGTFSEQSISYLLSVKKNTANQLQWQSDDLTQNNQLNQALLPDKPLTIQAVSTHSKTPITYKVAKGFESLVSVNTDSGELKAYSGAFGPFSVLATQAGNAYFGPSEISYEGQVGLKKPLLYWDSFACGANNELNLAWDSPSKQVQVRATNCFGKVSYGQINTQNKIIIIDEETGVITPKEQGVSQIFANFSESTECQTGRIECDVTVGKGQNSGLHWEPGKIVDGQFNIFLKDNTIVAIKAIKDKSNGKITYSIPRQQQAIATVDYESGKIDIHKIGQVQVTATQQADANYQLMKIEYTLTINDIKEVKVSTPNVANYYESVVGKEVAVEVQFYYNYSDMSAFKLSSSSSAISLSPVVYSARGFNFSYISTEKGSSNIDININNSAIKAIPIRFFKVLELSSWKGQFGAGSFYIGQYQILDVSANYDKKVNTEKYVYHQDSQWCQPVMDTSWSSIIKCHGLNSSWNTKTINQSLEISGTCNGSGLCACNNCHVYFIERHKKITELLEYADFISKLNLKSPAADCSNRIEINHHISINPSPFDLYVRVEVSMPEIGKKYIVLQHDWNLNTDYAKKYYIQFQCY